MSFCLSTRLLGQNLLSQQVATVSRAGRQESGPYPRSGDRHIYKRQEGVQAFVHAVSVLVEPCISMSI